MNSTLKALALLACLAALPASALNHEDVVAPITAARFAVACSNVEHDTSRIAPGRAVDYWEGNTVDGSTRYITDILAYPQTAVTFRAQVPFRPQLYPTQFFRNVEFAALVCYPTPRTNTDPNYSLPDNGGTVPRMQRRGEVPRLIGLNEYYQGFGLPAEISPEPPARLPLIVYSHGLGGSPVGKGYIDTMVAFASQGFMVAAVFHADARISPVIRIESLGDLAYTLAMFPVVVEMQAMRPLALKAMTDHLLLDQGFAVGIDPERIGGFGASLGGEAMAHLLGAKITSSLTRSCSETERDPRVRAAVGYVPFAGWSFLPAFCDGQSGAAEVNRPYLAIAGTLDTTAPLTQSKQALNRMQGSRYMVELVGGEHELRPEDAGDVVTWMVTFLNAYLDVRADPGAMGRFIRMKQVTGGRADILTVDVHVPLANTGGEAAVLEYYNTTLNHYFMAAGPDIDFIDTGKAGPGWIRTGESFKAWLQMPSDTLVAAAPVCRFYGVPAGGPNSHFFSASAADCSLLKRPGSGWFFEGDFWYIRPVPASGRCPDGHIGVNRVYNNRYYPWNDSNHRFTTSDSTYAEMVRKGWVGEGTVMCARP